VDVGVYARPVDLLGVGRMYAFEPAPDIVSVLRWSAQANGVSQRVDRAGSFGCEPGTFSLRAEDFRDGDSGVRSGMAEWHGLRSGSLR
jgi:hypothetical protein